jgi:uncharacterized protein YjdB/alpha-tubulin suppressor-like RCC1 family protein
LTLTLGELETEKLIPTVKPDKAKQEVRWSSSSIAKATVDQEGNVRAIADGNAVITVTTIDGNKTATCNVTVIDPSIVHVTGVTLNKASLGLGIDKEETLTATVAPGNADNKNVSWSSANAGIATVDQSGKVKGTGEGSTTVTVKTEDGNHTATCTITVTAVINVTGVSLNKVETEILIGQEETLIAFVEPAEANDKTVVWSSKDSTIATVDQTGKVKGITAGNTEITATTVDGEYTAKCGVTVKSPVIPVTGVTLSITTLNLYVNATDILGATVLPATATNQGVTWSSSNAGVATVSATGMVTGISKGTTTIAVKTDDGDYKAECELTVSINPAFPLKLSMTGTLRMVSGETKTLAVTVENTDYTVSVSPATGLTCTKSGNNAINCVASAGGRYTVTATAVADTSTKARAFVTVINTVDAVVGKTAVVGAGSSHTLVIQGDGSLWAWGLNTYGQIGDNSTTTSRIPVRIGTDNDWVAVSGGDGHSLALKSGGSLWAWGRNNYGQTGDGAVTANRLTPVRIGMDDTYDNDWLAISACNNNSMALKSDGSLWTWGQNNYRQIGDNTTTNRNTPTRIGADNDWVAVSSGASHAKALKSDGSIWAWGQNNYGQIADGTTTTRGIPTLVGSDYNWIAVSGNGNHSIALKSDGSLWAWGHNAYGQLGDDTTVNRDAITPVGTDKDWIVVSSGTSHSIALKTGGSLWTWGRNSDGQLGVGSTVTQLNVPTSIGNDWVSASGGAAHTVGVKSDGSLWTWGLNASGQIGDGTTTTRRDPVSVIIGTP